MSEDAWEKVASAEGVLLYAVRVNFHALRTLLWTERKLTSTGDPEGVVEDSLVMVRRAITDLSRVDSTIWNELEHEHGYKPESE